MLTMEHWDEIEASAWQAGAPAVAAMQALRGGQDTWLQHMATMNSPEGTHWLFRQLAKPPYREHLSADFRDQLDETVRETSPEHQELTKYRGTWPLVMTFLVKALQELERRGCPGLLVTGSDGPDEPVTSAAIQTSLNRYLALEKDLAARTA